MTVPSGERVLDLLPALHRALTGDGPALLPLPDTDPRSVAIAETLGAGEVLDPGEDDQSDPTALVMPTSGSTGIPKGALLPESALAASASATEERLGGPGRWLLALPAHHIAGMQVLLRAARSGGEPTVLAAGSPFTAADFVAAAERMPGPRRYVSLVPTQLARIVSDPAAAAATAEIFDAVLVGGAATPRALRRAAEDAGIRLVTTYGMTETCGGCVYDGRPLAGVTVEAGEDGAVVLTGPVVARGYRRRPGDPAFPGPGRFVTSDVGVIGADGTLTVTGRRDEMIVTGGVNVAPDVVEAALVALPGIEEAVVFGVPDPRWGEAVTALIEARRPWRLREVRAATATLPPDHRPRRLVQVDRIPHLPSGKPDRAAARAYALRHSDGEETDGDATGVDGTGTDTSGAPGGTRAR